MRDGGNVWEYAVIYVDDIIMVMKVPKAFFDDLQGPKIAFTMKGVGNPTYHLGADLYRDADGTLCLGAQTSYALHLSHSTGSNLSLLSPP